MKAIDITEEPVPDYRPIADAEIDDQQLEIGITVAGNMPVVINWRLGVAWIGSWDWLVKPVTQWLAAVEASKEVS